MRTRTRTRLSVEQRRKAKIRRECIRIRLEEQGVLAPPVLDVDQDGKIDTLEVGGYVERLLRALDVEVPEGLTSDSPEQIAEVLLQLLEDVGPKPLDDNQDQNSIIGKAKAMAMNEDTSPVQMRSRRTGQRTQLNNGGKPSIHELLKKPGSQLTFGERRRVALYRAGFGDPEASQK